YLFFVSYLLFFSTLLLFLPIFTLLSLHDALPICVSEADIQTFISLINANASDYLSSFKGYRKACEESDEVFEAFDDIVEVLMEWDLIEESKELVEALPDIEETRSKRPDSEPLLNILVPLKSNSLEYWKSNYKNSYAHDHNIKLAQEIAYARR